MCLDFIFVNLVVSMSVLSERLKRVRNERNLTQKQVGEGIGKNERHYQFYEYGKKEPVASNLVNLCRCLDVSSDYLLGLSDEPRRLDR